MACFRCGVRLDQDRRQGRYQCGDCKAAARRRKKALYGNFRRRARRFGVHYETIDRTAIYERDGWTCQLCGERIDRRVTADHDRAPSLDHIVPMSCGGNHESSNVQTAHRLCNAIKGASIWSNGEQLRLMG